MIALAIILPLGAVLPWKRASLSKSMQPLWGALALALAAGALVWTIQTGRTIMAPVGAILAVWLVAGAAVDLWTRTGRESDLATKLRRLKNLPRSDWGKAVAHAGLGITFWGIAAMLAWEIEDIRVAREGDTFRVGAYDVTLVDVHDTTGPNYITTMAEIRMDRNGRHVATLFPEKRFYPVAQMPTTEAAIDNGILRDLYVVIGDPQEGGGFAVRTYIKPFANWIWAGAIIMSLGSILSLTDRRYRIAAGARKAAPTPQGVPAE
jgi:cytochrome c-type biogenesis protein CcmF